MYKNHRTRATTVNSKGFVTQDDILKIYRTIAIKKYL